MKTTFRLMLLTATLLLIAPAFSFIGAQVPSVDTIGASSGPFLDGETSLSELVQWYHILYGVLTILLGYIGKAFGLQSKVKEYVYVVLAGGLVLAGGFITLGFGDMFQYLFSFLGAIGAYDLILKPGGNLINTLSAKQNKASTQ